MITMPLYSLHSLCLPFSGLPFLHPVTGSFPLLLCSAPQGLCTGAGRLRVLAFSKHGKNRFILHLLSSVHHHHCWTDFSLPQPLMGKARGIHASTREIFDWRFLCSFTLFMLFLCSAICALHSVPRCSWYWWQYLPGGGKDSILQNAGYCFLSQPPKISC